jgi:hypothetical protein
MPRKRKPTGNPPATDPSEGLDWDAALAPLADAERTFVRALLRGDSPESAAAYAGWSEESMAIKVLGRPQVRRALLALAPLLAVDAAGEARARAILRPFALLRIAGLLDIRGQNGLAAARDLLDATSGPGEAGRLRRAAEERARARSGGSDNRRYGAPGDARDPQA